MKTKNAIIALLLMGSIGAWADNVSPEQALNIANEWSNKGGYRAPGAAAKQLTLSHTAINAVDQATDFYVFNREGGTGFVIVAGNDAGCPVLAYSDQGSMDMANLPCNVQWWLEQYQQQELQLRQHPELARQQLRLANSVAPLMTTKWNQLEPYNNLCPTLDGEKTVTGCEATAIAQIMNFHKWPNKGIGSYTYDWYNNGTQLSCDFTQSTYQWDKMLDIYGNFYYLLWSNPSGECWDSEYYEYTDEQATAVATLMRDVGYATNMNYGLEQSDAWLSRFSTALYHHFDYDSGMQLIWRDCYDTYQWENIIFNELDNRRPILYLGMRGDVSTHVFDGDGHVFVLDGYDNNGYLHINWGWGGYDDGYFFSSALRTYNRDQTAWIGIQPNTGTGITAPLMGYCLVFEPMPNRLQANLGNSTYITLSFSFTTLKQWDSLHLGIIILNESESRVVNNDLMYDYTNTDFSEAYYWDYRENGYHVWLPSDLANGRYHLKLAFSTDNKATYTPFMCPVGHPGYILMEVKDGVAYFSLEEYKRGDVDNSGSLDGIDLNILINIILGKDNADNYGGRADLDGSGDCDGSDLNQLINLLLGK